MRIKVFVVAAGLLAGGLSSVIVNGCNGSSSSGDDTRRASQKGQACQITNDCANGLACVPVPGAASGICVVGEFKVSVTARECAVIECQKADDCCPTLSTSQQTACNNYLQLCAADGGTSSTYCQLYAQSCQCDTTKRDCVNSRCVSRCTSDVECVTSSQGSKCAGGTCVQCGADTDCGNNQQCLNGRCQAPCEGDGDCPGFQRCSAGKCIESSCQTDRECIAATKNVEATCGTDGKCIVPCQTDLECGNPTAYKFFSCISSQCVYTGCQSDKDCRLFISGPSDASVLPAKTHVVCRDKATPGTTTINP